MAAGASNNAVIVYDTTHTDGIKGNALLPLAAAAVANNMKEVDIQENEPAEIIDVDDDNQTDGDQENSTDENLGTKPISKPRWRF